MVDGGIIANTEPNALRDVVEAPNLLKSLLGGVGLPSSTPSSLTPSSAGAFGLGGWKTESAIGSLASLKSDRLTGTVEKSQCQAHE